MRNLLTPSRLRIAAAAAIAILVGWVYLPSGIDSSTADAVLNGRKIAMRSPVDGRLLAAGSALPQPGDPVAAGEPVASVAAAENEEDRRAASQREQDLAELERNLQQLATRQEAALQLKAQLEEQKAIWAKGMIERAVERARSTAEVAQSARKSADIARKEADKLDRIAAAGAISRIEADQAKSRSAQADAAMAAADADASRAAVEAQSARAGVNVIDGQNDVAYSDQKLHDVSTGLSTMAAEEAGIRAKIGEAERRPLLSKQYPIAAPANAVVWKLLVAAGSDVVKGQEMMELVDCNDLYVTARIDESEAKGVVPGDSVEVRIAGRDGSVKGTVRTIRGWSQDQSQDASAAAIQGKDKKAELEVGIDAKDLHVGDDYFCGVGASAEISFKRAFVKKWLP